MLFCKLVVLILGMNCVKDLGVTEIFKQITFEKVWGRVKIKKPFPEVIIHKTLETNRIHLKYCTTGKVQYVFLGDSY